MNFRTVEDLFSAVRKNGHKLPRDIELVVGVPRSGMLAGTAISLQLNRPLTDLNSFLEGRVYTGFSRRKGTDAQRDAASYKHVLIVDDSIFSGQAMQLVKDRIQELTWKQDITYAVIYGQRESYPEVDIVLEKCPLPRTFEWNLLNQKSLSYSCLDLDGVLCCDPAADEDDDGAKYAEFLRTALVLNAPRYRINSIVTARLEKYRSATEAWLHACGIEYDNLFMLDLPSADERRRLRVHADFKAAVYKERRDCWLFIESSTSQARIIYELSGKAVLAYGDMIFFSENGLAKIQRGMTRSGFRRIVSQMLPRRSKTVIKSVLRI